jgi:hypothetical protein
MSNLRVTNLKGRTAGSSPTLPDGAVVTGVTTSTSFDGNLNATQLSTGTVADARLGTVSSSKLSGALPALDGSALENLNIPAGFSELDAALFN